MGAMENPFEVLEVEATTDDFSALSSKPATLARPGPAPMPGAASIGRLHGFDLEDRPLVSGLALAPGEVLVARTTVPLLRKMVGTGVLLLFEEGDARRPIIVGVLQDCAPDSEPREKHRQYSVEADEDRHVITAEREIVLRCGDASITLTRAGKVIIKGNYVLSRSTGYNKIKGAAIDIN